MPIVASAFVHQSKIRTAVEKAEHVLAPDVVRIRYNIGENWAGDSAVFFRVVLSDQASQISGLRKVAQRVKETLSDKVRPDELGLDAYFNFRSVSEQAALKEEAWA